MNTGDSARVGMMFLSVAQGFCNSSLDPDLITRVKEYLESAYRAARYDITGIVGEIKAGDFQALKDLTACDPDTFGQDNMGVLERLMEQFDKPEEHRESLQTFCSEIGAKYISMAGSHSNSCHW